MKSFSATRATCPATSHQPPGNRSTNQLLNPSTTKRVNCLVNDFPASTPSDPEQYPVSEHPAAPLPFHNPQHVPAAPAH